MSNISYAQQIVRLKAIRKAAGITPQEAADFVHSDLRNWQRWEAGQYMIPESAVELLCLKTRINYEEFARKKTAAQIERDKKRQEKKENYLRLKSELSDDDPFDEEIPEVQQAMEKLKGDLQSQRILEKSQYNFDSISKKIFDIFIKDVSLIRFVFDEVKMKKDRIVELSDKKILQSKDFDSLTINSKIIVKVARNLFSNEKNDGSLYEAIMYLEYRSFEDLVKLITSLR